MKPQNSVLLGVNIDHVATLRQQRGTRYPETLQAALVAEQAGADAITVHLREDRRHIQDRDVALLKETLQTRMNLEMAATGEMLGIAKKSDRRIVAWYLKEGEELTTEGGLDVVSNQAYLKDYCQELAEAGCRVSLFIDADPAQLDAAVAVGAPVVEIHTGHYADTRDRLQRKAELERIIRAVNYGIDLGLQVNAGHGLDYNNVRPIASIAGISELNIGHAIISRALFSGLSEAVREMKRLIG